VKSIENVDYYPIIILKLHGYKVVTSLFSYTVNVIFRSISMKGDRFILNKETKLIKRHLNSPYLTPYILNKNNYIEVMKITKNL
jgi:hypothetical protein